MAESQDARGWQSIQSAPRGSPLLRINGPLIEVRFDGGHETKAYFGIGKDGTGPRWNDRNGLAMQEPSWWRREDGDPLDQIWTCLTCFWKGRAGELIARDAVRCPRCSSDNIHPTDDGCFS